MAVIYLHLRIPPHLLVAASSKSNCQLVGTVGIVVERVMLDDVALVLELVQLVCTKSVVVAVELVGEHTEPIANKLCLLELYTKMLSLVF